MNPISAIRPFPSAEVTSLLNAAQGALTALPGRIGECKDLPPLLNPQPVTATSEAQGSFSSMLGRLVQDVSAQQTNANTSVQGLMSGENVPLHQAVIAMEEASLSFQLMVEVRNKLLDSYQELMRMQI